MSHLFISYAGEDRVAAMSVVRALEERQLRCWIAPRDIRTGDNYAEAIMTAITASSALVLILSAHSNASPYVAGEVEAAFARRIRVLPLRIADVEPSPALALFTGTSQRFDALDGPSAARLREFACSVSPPDSPESEPISVLRVRDPQSRWLMDALELYEERIPAQEQFESPDIVRWLREDFETVAAPGTRDYCYVAVSQGEVVGFFLMHYYDTVRFAFIAYLVSAKGVGSHAGRVSQAILFEVRKLFEPGRELSSARGILAEVDHPLLAPDSKTRVSASPVSACSACSPNRRPSRSARSVSNTTSPS